MDPTTEPDVLDDLNEMWPTLAKTDASPWNRHQAAAIMVLAAVEIQTMRTRVKELEPAEKPPMAITNPDITPQMIYAALQVIKANLGQPIEPLLPQIYLAMYHLQPYKPT